MKNDLLEEIWRVREKQAARYDYDLHRMVVHLQEAQAKHGGLLVPVPKKPRRLRAKPLLPNAKRNTRRNLARA
jgi:hypothetical protein